MCINPKPAIAFLVTSQTHIQAKHEGIKYACNHYRSKQGVRYPCNQCDYQAETQSNFQTHTTDFL